MKRKSREINIFSMSALDLFASAMGAFILIMLILMPYYLKQTPSAPDPQEPVSCPTIEIPQCPKCPEPTEPIECEEPTVVEVPMLMDKLLYVEMMWTREVDIDLHIETPDGEYYHGRKYISGKDARLVHDNTDGGTSSNPALEIWRSFEPSRGNYQICLHYYSGSGQTNVNVMLQKPSGPVRASVTLDRPRQKDCPIQFEVLDNFEVQMERP